MLSSNLIVPAAKTEFETIIIKVTSQQVELVQSRSEVIALHPLLRRQFRHSAAAGDTEEQDSWAAAPKARRT